MQVAFIAYDQPGLSTMHPIWHSKPNRGISPKYCLICFFPSPKNKSAILGDHQILMNQKCLLRGQGNSLEVRAKRIAYTQTTNLCMHTNHNSILPLVQLSVTLVAPSTALLNASTEFSGQVDYCQKRPPDPPRTTWEVTSASPEKCVFVISWVIAK